MCDHDEAQEAEHEDEGPRLHWNRRRLQTSPKCPVCGASLPVPVDGARVCVQCPGRIGRRPCGRLLLVEEDRRYLPTLGRVLYRTTGAGFGAHGLAAPSVPRRRVATRSLDRGAITHGR